MDKIQEARQLFGQFKLDESQALCNAVLLDHPNQIEALLLSAKIASQKQDYGQALNYYNRIIELEQNNQEAKTAIQLIQNILGISNNFYYENPYTADELYEKE